ncbi:tRNA 2-selenouridine(34) synthase MnmH [Pseudomaricurvus alcaniphilus]|uniref:tRNA 2-selenouridine(34) synthase MnmH n=1 Tax=Pseudomaricurvus alcaniphilus TaxID=1166482 RepID=UPI00140A8718|nr:tRNA 2-selenouridine(34) synthase MnmH [Pseudomaricurvus alcaniphilus]NHN36035.1 tRNA 2-selenouridine(34) synthase MnmH [Pseudomaricurvus alcaniphilus]
MTHRPDTQDYRTLFLQDVPLLDVRAPVEFAKGAFPTSVNVPLLDDEQRHAIGLRYKNKGPDAAIELGWKFATQDVRAQRLRDWKAFIERHPDGFLYCFRGGLRSRLSQQLLRDNGAPYPLIKGGYKAMRRFLLDELEHNCVAAALLVVGGRTGSGKTRLLQRVAGAVDLEQIANHRGSAFGRQLSPQPSQIDFENTLSIAIMKQRQHHSRLVMEDESRMIGRVNIPLNLRAALQGAELAVLETSMDERVAMVLEDYVTLPYPRYLKQYGEEQGRQVFREHILGNLKRISKRLGSDRYQQLQQLFCAGLTALESTGSTDEFRPGIERLLTQYYDPMYDYQQEQRRGREVVRGSMDDLIKWISEHRTAPP